MKAAPFLPLLLIMIVAVSGCVIQQASDEQLKLDIQVEPNPVFSGTTTTLYADIRNDATVTYSGIIMRVFDPSYFSISGCSKTIPVLRPYGAESMKCSFIAPQVERDVTSNIGVSVMMSGSLNANVPVKMVGIDEYELARLTEPIERYPASFSYSDINLKMLVEFSDEFPMVIHPRDDYMYITISNNGQGRLQPLSVRLSGSGSSVIESCDRASVIEPMGDEYPRISCKLRKPQTKYLSQYDLLISVNYAYEIRKTIPVEIIR